MKHAYINGCTLVRTCSACPEQYDVYVGTEVKDENQIGYLRLRHGHFYAAYPDYNGKVVYSSYPKGDGIFEDDERVQQLQVAVFHLLNRHNHTVLINDVEL